MRTIEFFFLFLISSMCFSKEQSISFRSCLDDLAISKEKLNHKLAISSSRCPKGKVATTKGEFRCRPSSLKKNLPACLSQDQYLCSTEMVCTSMNEREKTLFLENIQGKIKIEGLKKELAKKKSRRTPSSLHPAGTLENMREKISPMTLSEFKKYSFRLFSNYKHRLKISKEEEKRFNKVILNLDHQEFLRLKSKLSILADTSDPIDQKRKRENLKLRAQKFAKN